MFKDLFIQYWPTLLIILAVGVYTVYLVVNKRWDELRTMAYTAIRMAEKAVTGTRRGQERFEYAFNYLYNLIPGWLRFFISEESLREKLQEWFNDVKDYLDDGKVNGTTKPVSTDF